MNYTATEFDSFNINTQGGSNITGSDVVLNDPEDGYGINGVLGNNIEKSKLDINNGNAHYQRRKSECRI